MGVPDDVRKECLIMERNLQFLTVRDLFSRWLNSAMPDSRSIAHRAYKRLLTELVEPAVGSCVSGSIEPEESLRRIRETANALRLESAAAGHHALWMAMAWAQLWPATPVVYEPFNTRAPIEIPLSAFQVAELVTRLPVNYRVPCHILLLTGIKPAMLAGITMASFQRTFDVADEPGSQDHIHSIFVANHPLPLYLSNPVLSAMRKYVVKAKDTERVFSMTGNAISATWNRYADDAPGLNRFKGTAATHLLRLGADAHVIAANLGISQQAGEALIERLRPSKQPIGREVMT